MSTRYLFESRASYGYIEPCYYCGQVATGIDHVVPLSMLVDLAILDDPATTRALVDRFRIQTVPACQECNSILGNKYFDTLPKRRDYVKRRLAVLYRKVLATPEWSDSELGQLESGLRNYVLVQIDQQRLARKRLAWRQGHNPETVNRDGDTLGTAAASYARRRRAKR